jgi:acyl phosphate:glycerol-3-phosphate acyltransferase
VADVGLVALGYVLGSLPWGLWLPRLATGKDIRRVGSGNMGAANVWRTFGFKLGLGVALLDIGKGLAAALIGKWLGGELVGVLAGVAAMAGHWRPLFLRFARGGKMVATCGGAFLGVAPLVGLCGAAVWVAIFLAFRYASVASIVAGIALPVFAAVYGYPLSVVLFGAAAATAILYLHRGNLRRLRAGTEHRFELRRPASA